MSHQPRSELSRYAFGYSDKKPGLSYWLILAGMLAFVVFNIGEEHLRIEPAKPAVISSQ